MNKPFIYGMSVEGENFTDRELETKRLKLNFENGVNSIRLKSALIEREIVEHTEAGYYLADPLFKHRFQREMMYPPTVPIGADIGKVLLVTVEARSDQLTFHN